MKEAEILVHSYTVDGEGGLEVVAPSHISSSALLKEKVYRTFSSVFD